MITLLLLTLCFTSCATRQSSIIDAPITKPVATVVPYPAMPEYPSDMGWTYKDGFYMIPEVDGKRLVEWLTKLSAWDKETIPAWLEYEEKIK